MDAIFHNGEAMPYPKVPNHIVDDPTPRDQAIYVPSISPGFATAVHEGQWSRALPQGVSASDLNFLDPANPLMRLSHAMTSAGQALKQAKPCIITERDRSGTLIVGDSGGYQIASGRLTINGNADRLRILRWLEATADVAMTLDVPTFPVIKNPALYRFKSTADCLTETLDHLKFFAANRNHNSGTRFLNVLQGNNQAEADTWYDHVKTFDFEGWAFGGVLRNNFYEVCRRILIMAREGQLQGKSWIHILGTCELDTAVLLTALQRAINTHINPNLRISYDTSSPFRMSAYNSVYTLPSFTAKELTMGAKDTPDDMRFIGSQVRWPWPSPIGDRMVMADFCVPGHRHTRHYRDQLSETYAAHHNLGALCWGIATANRVFDAECLNHDHTIALPVGAAAEAIEKVISSGSMQTLSSFAGTFANLRHGKLPDSGDEDRAY
ncbi:hypothetical protein AQZ52_02015 [Novosphingobium fuchskuhlense]|uniref:Uncharacterized protein n=1 Tax=Novosphingobium fuchskuhlense TaxID=1117702 RepID=A0A117UWD6_9SPHN|nr:hypothetical protein [Novosphingobium fuchskuhlense]KUR72106.1 hypothetical protein AQZ52_02015 [Novosphingobium fuchskuhlense]